MAKRITEGACSLLSLHHSLNIGNEDMPALVHMEAPLL